ncbi:MAG: M23 family metallopeptidase [Pseudomarimonas sp.]
MSVLATASFANQPLRLDLPTAVEQGSLVVGITDPAIRVRLGERSLRVDDGGRFVFGVGRDEPGPVTLQLSDARGGMRLAEVRVNARAWPTERVNGVAQETVTPSPAMAARIAREQAAVALARQRDDARSDFATPFQWPLKGRISGVFGSQRIYNGEPRSPHSGLDVAAATGTPLRAPAAGVVTFAEPDLYLTGGTVLLDHGHGVSSVFLHLSRIDVVVGQQIESGQVLGAVGATGRASGPHMHWGLNWFDVRLDPSLLPGIKAP